MVHRWAWQQDSTVVLACGAYRELGEPEDFPETLGDPLAIRLVEDVDTPCGSANSIPTPRVNVVDVVVGDSNAVVTLRVVRSDRAHSEIYSLDRRRSRWVVREVVMTDWLIH